MMDTKTGLTSYSIKNPWLTLEPSDIYVTFIEAENFYGKIDPFELQRMNLQRLELYVDRVTLRPISADFNKEFVTDAYSGLDSKHSILLYDFIRRYAVFHIKTPLGIQAVICTHL